MNIGGFLRRNAAGIVMLAGLVVMGGLIVYPFFASARYNARRSVCLSNLKFIAMACQQYSADYDGRYPPLSDGGSRGWSVLLQSGNAVVDDNSNASERLEALEKGKVLFNFSCPEGYDSAFSPTSDYFFNARLATRKEASVREPDMTISFGDGPDNGPSNSHYWELPSDGANENLPLQRHNGHANYAFADGHVKSLNARRLREWWENSEEHKAYHYKLAPEENASRVMPRKKAALPLPDAQTNGLHKPTLAARSFKKNY